MLKKKENGTYNEGHYTSPSSFIKATKKFCSVFGTSFENWRHPMELI